MNRPLLTDQDWDAMMDKITRQSAGWDQSNKLIYQWVKQNRISPRQMSDLSVAAWKHFVY